MRKKLGGRGIRIRLRVGGWPIEGRHVVLVDDVRTTGATIRRGVRMLRQLQPASVTAAGVFTMAVRHIRRERSDQMRPDALVAGLAWIGESDLVEERFFRCFGGISRGRMMLNNVQRTGRIETLRRPV